MQEEVVMAQITDGCKETVKWTFSVPEDYSKATLDILTGDPGEAQSFDLTSLIETALNRFIAIDENKDFIDDLRQSGVPESELNDMIDDLL